MTKEEVIKILVRIEAVYSYCMTKDETVSYWFEFCQLMNYQEVLAKLQAHIRKSPYPPVIADLAVFTTEENEVQEKLERWILEGMQRLERDRSVANRKHIPAWMLEYSPRPASTRS